MEAQDFTGERANSVLIAARLVSEFGYSPASADTTARDLIGCSPAVWEAFSCWWQTGDFAPLEVEGFSAERLVRDHGLLAPGAFLMLDWLLKNPNAAKAALMRGHDSVGHGPARRRR